MIQSSTWERALSILIVLVLTAAVAQGAWVGYKLWVEPSAPQEWGVVLPSNVPDLRGEPLPNLSSLTPLRGTAVQRAMNRDMQVVAFLLTTCSACERAKPALEDMYARYGNEFGFIGVFSEPSEVVEQYGMHFPSFLDVTRETFDAFGANAVPMFVIAQDGRITHQIVGWSPEIGERLNSILAEAR